MFSDRDQKIQTSNGQKTLAPNLTFDSSKIGKMPFKAIF